MKLHFFLALALLSPIAGAQSFDETMTEPAAAPPPAEPAPPATQPSDAPPPDTSETVPMSSFEAIRPPEPMGRSPTDAATAAPPLRLQIDPSLSPIGSYSAPPPVAPRIPGREPEEPRAPAPSDWR